MDQGPIKRPQFFFTTAPMPCPYIDGRLERKVVTDISGPDAVGLHENLSRAGFRRSHTIAYAPVCPGCNACVPVRIRAKEFQRRRTLNRIWEANGDLRAKLVEAKATVEQFHLFMQYQQHRHGESDMALMGFFDYRSMVEESPIETQMVEFRDDTGVLIAACLLDNVADGTSAVYSFFDTTLPAKRSLGTFMILWLIEHTVRSELDFVYLGYWIENSRKMAYKERFKPLDLFGPEGWTDFDARTKTEATAPDRDRSLDLIRTSAFSAMQQ
ncbi:MAG: arginyltransferase [Rhodospirillaceae bacterium]